MKKDAQIFIWIGLGGSLGACFRYAASFLYHGDLPLPTLIVNLTGCFLLTYLTNTIAVTSTFSKRIKLAVTVGFLGSLTTFSTFSLEVLLLLERDIWSAAFYLFISLVSGITACWLGYQAARKRQVLQ